MSDNDYDYETKSVHLLHTAILQNKWRVKLYHLNQMGQWDDMGTGHVCIKKNEEFYIKMVSETNNESMFELKLMGELEFHRQRGTILTWKSKKEEEDDDTAVSFQDKEGIREVWKFICNLKGAEPHEDMYEMDEEDDEILPEPTVENLSYLAREIRPDMPPNRIIKILDYISMNKGQYVKKLGEVLEDEEKQLEEKKSEITTKVSSIGDEVDIRGIDPKNSQFENLSLIFSIFKNIFYIADQNTLELLLNDELYLITFGALEYDFESQKMIKHRQFFKEITKFKNILNIEDTAILNKIHLNHRLTYLRDTAIGRFIEEMTIKHINVMVHYNNSDIIQFFLNNRPLLKKIIDRIFENDYELKNEGVLFLLELITCCKDLLNSKFYFYESLCELNLIEALEKTLIDVTHYSSYNKYLKSLKEDKLIEEDSSVEENYKKEKIKINAIEILINVLTVVPNILKTYITGKHQKNKEHPLLSELCNILIHQENFGIKSEIGELLKSLLDNEVNEKKNEFYDLFYNKCLKKLVEFLEIPLKSEFKYEMISSKQIIIEILCHCLKQHEYWIIHNDLITKVLFVLQDQSKVLHLHVVKFIKSVLLNNDENLLKLIINDDVFASIIKIFNENKQKDNLLLSSILDLFEHIKKQNVKKVISYLFEKHYDFFYSEVNKRFFTGLISKYEAGLDQFSAIKVNEESEEKMKYPGWTSREISAKEDEDYFNDDVEEDEDDIFKKQEVDLEDEIGSINTLNEHINVTSEEIEFENILESNFTGRMNKSSYEYEHEEANLEFLGKKISSQSDLINIYKENDEGDEISSLIKKKKLDEEEEDGNNI